MKKLVLAALTLVFFTSSAHAVSFRLSDHPNGALASTSPYGIRLDAFDNRLISVDGLILTVGGTSASITGRTTDQFGGIFDISANIDIDTSDPRPGGQFLASGGVLNIQQVSGSAVPVGGSFLMDLDLDITATGGNPFIFLFDGHRLPGNNIAAVGRGWLDAAGTNDFLFTASPVPLPAAVWLFGSALVGLVAVRRRRMNAISA